MLNKELKIGGFEKCSCFIQIWGLFCTHEMPGSVPVYLGVIFHLVFSETLIGGWTWQKSFYFSHDMYEVKNLIFIEEGL